MQNIAFGNDLPGYELGEKNAPAVIVIQEWWGVNDVLKELAEKVHNLGGYRVLIPDLYKGEIGVEAEEAKHLVENMGFANATEELKQAVIYLRNSGSTKVGVVGFCMGGALTFCAAQHCNVDCAAPFYGIPAPDTCDLTKITVPVEAHFGRLDSLTGFSDLKSAEAAEARMKEANVPCTFYYYEAGHAFMNGVSGNADREKLGFPHPTEEVREEAWKRLESFFAANLKPQA